MDEVLDLAAHFGHPLLHLLRAAIGTKEPRQPGVGRSAY